MKVNVKEEFLGAVKEYCDTFMHNVSRLDFAKLFVKCALIGYKSDIFVLKCGYSDEEYINFLNCLDFETQNDQYNHINGVIWFVDGISWAEREEINGINQWCIKTMPNIPTICNKQP